jgi:uncharacterized protein YceK
MSNFDNDNFGGSGYFWSGWPSQVKAALIFTIPFVIVDLFNYFFATLSVGTVFAISCPLLFLLYAGCGAVATRFSSSQGFGSTNDIVVGATAGAALWLISTIVNTIISLILGTASLGTTLILGVPYIICCAPLSLIMGAIAGAAGALIVSRLFGHSTPDEF